MFTYFVRKYFHENFVNIVFFVNENLVKNITFLKNLQNLMSSKYFNKNAEKFAFRQLSIAIFAKMHKWTFSFQSYPSFLSYLYSYFSILTSNFRDYPENEKFSFQPWPNLSVVFVKNSLSISLSLEYNYCILINKKFKIGKTALILLWITKNRWSWVIACPIKIDVDCS